MGWDGMGWDGMGWDGMGEKYDERMNTCGTNPRAVELSSRCTLL